MLNHQDNKCLSIFVSYSIKDKLLAGKLKECFEEYFGLKVFLAHADILPSSEWNPAIIDSLKTSDFVVMLVSKNSENSAFVNQEMGMALAWHKKIIPLKIDRITNPFGFINKIQACNCTLRNTKEIDTLETCSTIFFIFTKSQEYYQKAINSVIFALSQSNCFDTSIIVSKTLKELYENNQFIKKQIDQIKKILQTNDQIYKSFVARPLIEKILKDNV
jgi:hypothetical protein